MPTYIFQHPKTQELKEIVQRMNDPHVYVDEKGVKWDRLWTIPQANIDEPLDPFDEKSFVRKTGKRKGTLGDLFDQAKEASDKRIQTLGHDPIQREWLKEWGKKRGGRKHPLLNE